MKSDAKVCVLCHAYNRFQMEILATKKCVCHRLVIYYTTKGHVENFTTACENVPGQRTQRIIRSADTVSINILYNTVKPGT